MSGKKIKKEIHQLIDAIEDENILNMLKEDISTYTKTSGKDILDELTPEQVKELDEAIKDVDEGNLVSWDKYVKATERWRTK